jgi:hypothetical protein
MGKKKRGVFMESEKILELMTNMHADFKESQEKMYADLKSSQDRIYAKMQEGFKRVDERLSSVEKTVVKIEN